MAKAENDKNSKEQSNGLQGPAQEKASMEKLRTSKDSIAKPKNIGPINKTDSGSKPHQANVSLVKNVSKSR